MIWGCFLLFLIAHASGFLAAGFEDQWQCEVNGVLEKLAFDPASGKVFFGAKQWIAEASFQEAMSATYPIEGSKKAIAYDCNNSRLFYQLALDHRHHLYYSDGQNHRRIYRSDVIDFCIDPKTSDVLCSCSNLGGNGLKALCRFDSRGELIWHYPVQAPTATFYFDVPSGKVICCDFGPQGNQVFCLDSSGKLLWRHLVSENAAAIACDVQGGRVFYGVSHKSVCCVDRESQINWEYPLVSRKEQIIAIFVDAESELVIVEAHDNLGHLYCLSFNGELLWEYAFDRAEQKKAVVDLDSKKIFFIAGNGKELRCIDYKRECVWSRRLDGYVDEIILDSKRRRLIWVTSLSMVHSMSYASLDCSVETAIEQWQLEKVDEPAVSGLDGQLKSVEQWKYRKEGLASKGIFFDPIDQAVFWLGNQENSGRMYRLSLRGKLKATWLLPNAIKCGWYHRGQRRIFYTDLNDEHHLFDLNQRQSVNWLDRDLEVTAYSFDFTSEKAVYGESAGSTHFVCRLNSAGEKVWAYPTENKVAALDFDPESNHIFYGLESRNGVYCVGLDGVLKWRYPLRGMTEEPSEIVVDCANQRVFLGTYDHRYAHLRCLDFSGSELWTYCARGRIVNQGLVVDPKSKKVFFAATHGRWLYCLNSIGKLLWKRELDDHPRGLAIDFEHQLLFCLLHQGQCQAIRY
ncbi:MAG: PQQ-binding-like beta-propeller repeat protein [Chlamydiota bacterium]